MRGLQELCNGGSLRRAVERGVFGVQHASHWQRASLTLLHIALGMSYVHANRVMHGALNPSHVFFKVRAPPACCAACESGRQRATRCLLPPILCMHACMQACTCKAAASALHPRSHQILTNGLPAWASLTSGCV